jgi:CRP-like cAMP-binding protein
MYKAELAIIGESEIFGDEDMHSKVRTITATCNSEKGELLCISVENFKKRLAG